MTKSGYHGDNLIGFRGFCEKCGSERRIYYVKCNDEIKRKMVIALRNHRLNYIGSCEVCLCEGLKYSVREWHIMSSMQVDRDLSVLEKGLMNINFDKADSDARENAQNDIWLENNEKYVDEYRQHRSGKKLLIY